MSPKRRRHRTRTRQDEPQQPAEASPAERYRAFKERQAHRSPLLDQFVDQLGFFPDPYQLEAIGALDAGESVLVAAPTGAGKTVVAEYAIARTLAGDDRLFYTTPIKALSNQKYRDFCDRFGAENVGLATGDVTINAHAQVVVMTTEVLRNMLYRFDSRIDSLAFVVMDEVHYLADHFRGPVWEEVIIHLPAHVALVSLSATVSNAEEFGDWLQELRGATRVVVSETRPVPLVQHMCVAGRIYPLYADRGGDHALNHQLLTAIESASQRRHTGRGPQLRRIRRTSHVELAEALRREHMLPAIDFIFSRNGCDQAVSHLLGAGVLLTTVDEAHEIADYIRQATAEVDPQARKVLRLAEFQAAAEAGIAAHHAGMLPLLKEIVETLFSRGLLKIVFATETLALGINMPAKTVVIESLTKWDGRDNVRLTPGQYTQLTGRAGRRSMDTLGHAVVLYGHDQNPRVVSSLASKRSYPLISAFHPTYNMTANLLAHWSIEESRSLMERSFAQFQADRMVVGRAQEAAKLRKRVEREAQAVRCSRGDYLAYSELVQQLHDAERSRPDPQIREAARALIAQARVGDVIGYREGGREIIALVVGEPPSGGAPVLDVLTQSATLRHLSTHSAPLTLLGYLATPGLQPRKPRDRQRMASLLRRARREGDWQVPLSAASGETARQLRDQVVSHPCHTCPDRKEHKAKMRGYLRDKRKLDQLLASIEHRTSSIGVTFDRVREILRQLGYVTEEGHLTDDGHLLAGIYAEYDLLTAECLRHGVFDGLSPAALAGAVSACLYTPRGDQPTQLGEQAEAAPGLGAALRRIDQAKSRIATIEGSVSAPRSGEPDPGMARPIAQWAQGVSLDVVLAQADGLTAGDFVRIVKQVIDMLRQLRALSPTLAHPADQAIHALRHGVVAWSDTL